MTINATNASMNSFIQNKEPENVLEDKTVEMISNMSEDYDDTEIRTPDIYSRVDCRVF